MLNVLMGEDAASDIILPKTALSIPEISFIDERLKKEGSDQKGSWKLKESEAMVKEAKAKKKLADLTYMPDFMVSFKNRCKPIF